MFSAQTSHNYSAQFESVQIRIKETLNPSKKKIKKTMSPELKTTNFFEFTHDFGFISKAVPILIRTTLISVGK